MKALKSEDNILLFEAPRIEFGIYDEPDVQKWAMFNENDEVMLYAIDNNFELVEFDETKKPEDYVEGKYFYIDGEFVLNPDWREPLPPIEDQVKMLAEDLATVAQNTEDIEEALCELSELIAE